MAKDNKVRMPSSMAGITQFHDESTSNFVLTPKQVIIVIAVVVAIVLSMHALA